MKNLLSFLFVTIVTLPNLFAQTITIINPDTGLLGQSISVSIYGQSTTFTQGTSLTAWFSQGSSTLYLNSVNPVNDSLLTGIANIPTNAATGYWDANVFTDLMGTITAVNGFYIDANPIAIAISQTNATCASACDGTASATPTGCGGVYTYLWNDPAAQTNATATGLCAGSYTVTVTAGACVNTAGITVGQPTVLSSTITSVNDPGGCIGSGSISVSGGTAPYLYQWDDPSLQSTATATGLCTGLFHVTVTDNNGCMLIDSVNVLNTLPTAIVLVSPDTGLVGQSISVSIYGQSTMFTQGSSLSAWFSQGSSTLNLNSVTPVNDSLLTGIANIPTNAATGYWDANVFTSLMGTITMANGFYIEANALAVAMSQTNATCASSCDGTASATASGCSGVYTYLWNDPAAQTTATATGLCAGTYSVVVSDNTGCNATGTVSITQPSVLLTSVTSVNSLGSCNGSGTVTATGGVTPYTYLWNDPMTQSTAMATGLCGGAYQVIVMDNNGCTAMNSIFLSAVKIDSAAPDTMFRGQTLTVSIYGQGTLFTQGSVVPSVSFTQGSATINMGTVNVINDNLLDGIVSIPTNASPGLWDVNVWTDLWGTLTMPNGFYICGGDCVWPGDANSDNIANNLDLLSIGVGFGSTGPARAGASLNWTGQPASDWTGSLNSGANYKHVDCNGDGLIDNSDTLAIALNYGFTHNKTTVPNVAAANDPALYLEVVVDTIVAGGQLTVRVNLGTSGIPADSIYGLAFTINYDPTLVDSGTVQMSFGNSWLGTIGTDLISLQYDSYSGGKIDVGITRTDQTNVAGFGQISELVLTTASNLPGGPSAGLDTLIFTISDLTVIASNENLLSTNITNDSLIVEDVQTGLDHNKYENSEFYIYPNPSTGQFTIIRNNAEQAGELGLIVYEMNGQKVLEETSTEAESKIDLTHLSKGLYYLQLKTATGIIVKKVIIH